MLNVCTVGIYKIMGFSFMAGLMLGNDFIFFCMLLCDYIFQLNCS